MKELKYDEKEGYNLDKNTLDKTEEEKIEKYKKSIENFLKSRNFDLVEKARDELEKLLDLDFKNHKINEVEYDILNNYLETSLNNILMGKEESKSDKSDKMSKFKNELKVSKNDLPILKVTPIYKGKMGVIAPNIDRE